MNQLELKKRSRRPRANLAIWAGATALLVAVPIVVTNTQVRTTSNLVIHCEELPANDEALTQWLSERTGVARVNVTRNNDKVTASFEAFDRHLECLSPPLDALGYGGKTKVVTSATRSYSFFAPNDFD